VDRGLAAVVDELEGVAVCEADAAEVAWEAERDAALAANRRERVVLVVHDTGGLIGLRGACAHADVVAGPVTTKDDLSRA
jgi:hypothetical protein